MMTAAEINNQVSIVALLERLGYRPFSSSGTELLYTGIFNDEDIKPTFLVNDHLGVWFDHRIGQGGNIVDFGLAYWKTSPEEVLEKINKIINMPLNDYTSSTKVKSRKRSAVKIPHYEIEAVKELGNNPEITDYLKIRNIWQSAQGRLKEVYYFVEDQKKLRKQFSAAGWQNEIGAWEVSNFYFKACLGHRALTYVPGDEESVAVFSGYLNYLSWRFENPLATESIITFNNAALIQGALRKAKNFGKIKLFFHRDNAGQLATLEFMKTLPQAIDCSHFYENFIDYNEKLKHKMNK